MIIYKGLRILKNGSIGVYIKENKKWIWRIIKGPSKKIKKYIHKIGGKCNCNSKLNKTFFFEFDKINNKNINNNQIRVYYPNSQLCFKNIIDFMNNPNKIVDSDILENCICNGIRINNLTLQSNSINIKQLDEKGKSGTPYGIFLNKNSNKINFVTKYTKIDIKSLTRKKKTFLQKI